MHVIGNLASFLIVSLMTWCQINPIDKILYCRYWFLVIYEWQNFHLSFWTCHNICMKNTCRSCHFTNGSTCTSVWQGSTQLWIWNFAPPIHDLQFRLVVTTTRKKIWEFIWIKKIIPCKCHLPLGNCRQQKSSNERPTKTNMHMCFKTY